MAVGWLPFSAVARPVEHLRQRLRQYRRIEHDEARTACCMGGGGGGGTAGTAGAGGGGGGQLGPPLSPRLVLRRRAQAERLG